MTFALVQSIEVSGSIIKPKIFLYVISKLHVGRYITTFPQRGTPKKY
ncbi:unnamed protein product [Spodoptera littoralis]|uniref:Uncharacterized protein n=1 Tax=Spodoptera littoralis TaxID=7109 RepID=A0A9P0HVI4_SPOLI|nr:unnamed protein product [Spodoptera littoralis]CAH1635156.1 unnamed protein product [Spodoptera littoralis]